MGELMVSQGGLPSVIEDVARFVLVGREKLASVRAEIRAIDKLQLAQDVYDQKMDEARMLAEALLDAEVRLGELFKQIPKASGARTDLQPTDTDVARLPIETKQRTVESLGFTPKQGVIITARKYHYVVRL